MYVTAIIILLLMCQMHVLGVLSFVVERVGVAIRPHANALVQYLPLLWAESADHNMLRCAIVSTLVHLVKVSNSDNLQLYIRTEDKERNVYFRHKV